MLIAVLGSSAAFAQEAPKDEKSAVELANAAFEFRDFQKVLDLLRPWVHPMRILDDKLKVEARSLMGVSLHLLGRVEEAKEEFGDLLLIDPRHELDPFVVPPEVIATFEGVRRELKPTLDKILAERGENPNPEPPMKLKLVVVPHRATAFLPFGVPQFVLDQPGWGASFAVVQTLGLAANIGGWIGASRTPPDLPAYDRWLAVMYSGLAVAVLAYVGSVIHGIFLLDRLEADVQATP